MDTHQLRAVRGAVSGRAAIVVAALALTACMTTVVEPPNLHDDAEAQALAGRFCAFVAGPKAPDMFASLASPSLLEAVRVALAKNDAFASANPTEKPPLGDGIPYTSYPDRPPACEPGAVLAEGGGRQVEVRYRFPDKPEADWTDRLSLAQAPRGWAIDDIRYATADYSDGLREALNSAFE